MINIEKLEKEGKLCQICEGDWISCSYGDEYGKTGKCSHVKEDLKKIFKPRYEVKYGRFGAYFYDNKHEKDMDLEMVLRQLRKLQMYEQNK